MNCDIPNEELGRRQLSGDADMWPTYRRIGEGGLQISVSIFFYCARLIIAWPDRNASEEGNKYSAARK